MIDEHPKWHVRDVRAPGACPIREIYRDGVLVDWYSKEQVDQMFALGRVSMWGLLS